MLGLVAASILNSAASRGEAMVSELLARLSQTPTVQRYRPQATTAILPGQRMEVTVLPGGKIGLTEGLCDRLSEPEISWVLAHQLAHLTNTSGLSWLKSETETNRLALTIYQEAGYDPFTSVMMSDKIRGLYALRQGVGPHFKAHFACSESQLPSLAPLAFAQLYRSETLVGAAHSSKRRPRLGTVEHIWDYRDRAWRRWLAVETGIDAAKQQTVFAGPQCTALVFDIRPDFRYDPRRNGANDAGKWYQRGIDTGMPTGSEPKFLAIGVESPWPGNVSGHVFVVLDVLTDGRLRIIDCNFGPTVNGVPDGKVRVRLIEPDDYLIGYIYSSTDRNSVGQRITLSTSPVPFGPVTRPGHLPFWHTRIDPAVIKPGQYRLRLKARVDPDPDPTVVSPGGGWFRVVLSSGASLEVEITSGATKWWQTEPFELTSADYALGIVVASYPDGTAASGEFSAIELCRDGH